MDLAPVIEALQATLSPQHRKQAEEKLAQVYFLFSKKKFKFNTFFLDLQNNGFCPMSCADYSQ